MAAPLLIPICFSLVLTEGFLQEPADARPPGTATDYRVVARKADALLHRQTGTNLVMDDAIPGVVHRFRRPTHRVHWSMSSKDQRLTSISVEPVGPEEEGTTALMAALLMSVAAVDSIEEGSQMALLVKEGQVSEGMARMVSLKNGIKLYRLQSDHQPKYRITL